MGKKIILALDSFKGSATSLEIESYIERGIMSVLPTAKCVKIPIADGGEGTVDAIVTACHGEYREVEVQDPLGRTIMSSYGLLPDGVAVIEMSKASGITFVRDDEKNPLKTSTFGTGQLIRDALDHGAHEIYIGIGGSATNDGGLGMAMALGVQFYDVNGVLLPAMGESASRVARIDCSNLDKRLQTVPITILSDVDNPLCGERGASVVYGPQKGATSDMVKALDAGLSQYAQVIKEQLGKDVIDVPGAGAAGGLGAGFLVFTNATMKNGIHAVLELVQMKEQLRDADIVITGEGRMDFQTAFGKAPVGIAKLAKEQGLPVLAVVGSVAHNADNVYDHGIDFVIDLVNQPMSLAEAMGEVDVNAVFAGKSLGQLIKNLL